MLALLRGLLEHKIGDQNMVLNNAINLLVALGTTVRTGGGLGQRFIRQFPTGRSGGGGAVTLKRMDERPCASFKPAGYSR